MNLIRWLGTVSSILGAFLVAGKFFLIGYIFFTIGALAWLIIGVISRDHALGTLNLVFLCANILGLYNFS
jgi:hypothetical protein